MRQKREPYWPDWAKRRFCTKGQAWSAHCSAQRKPVRRAISGISCALYLWELSVQMLSPASSTMCKLASRMCATCRHAERRIEMHLRSTCRQVAHIREANLHIVLEAGESIWTESSHKYKAHEIPEMARRTGFRCAEQWADQAWPFVQNLLFAQSGQ